MSRLGRTLLAFGVSLTLLFGVVAGSAHIQLSTPATSHASGGEADGGCQFDWC